MRSNWKTYTDNFVEGYHIPGIHPGFMKVIEFSEFETVAHNGMVRMTAPQKNGSIYGGKWLWMWPNWTLSVFPGGMNTSRINPLAVKPTELIYDFYFAEICRPKASRRAERPSMSTAASSARTSAFASTRRITTLPAATRRGR